MGASLGRDAVGRSATGKREASRSHHRHVPVLLSRTSHASQSDQSASPGRRASSRSARRMRSRPLNPRNPRSNDAKRCPPAIANAARYASVQKPGDDPRRAQKSASCCSIPAGSSRTPTCSCATTARTASRARRADMSGFAPDFARYDVVVLEYNGDDWPERVQRSFERYMEKPRAAWSQPDQPPEVSMSLAECVASGPAAAPSRPGRTSPASRACRAAPAAVAAPAASTGR